MPVPLARSRRIARSTAFEIEGRPRRLPWTLARSRPALTRSWIIARFDSSRRWFSVVGRDLLTVSYQNQKGGLYGILARRLADYLDVSGDELPEGAEINDVG